MTQLQLEQLLGEHQTPLYVFDLGALRRRVDSLRARLPEGVALCYAMKANPFVVKALEGSVDRFEVCSPGEYRICRALELPTEQLVISGVHKAREDTEEMVSRFPEMTYTVESAEQYFLLSLCARKHKKKLRVLLRLSSGNQFGLDESLLRELIRDRAQTPWLHIAGIQLYSGTQKHSLRKLTRELTRLSDLMTDMEQTYGFRAEELEFGPGFPVAYFQGEDFDEDAFLASFSELLRPLLDRVHVTLELGRSIAACCGTYVTRVADAKTNKKERYAILDGGIHHLVYFGQSMAMKLPHFQLLPPREGEEVPWNLCGSLCTVNDLLVKQLPVADLNIGDVFAFERAGAYSMTEGASLFLSRDLPGVVFLHEDGHFEAVRDHLPTWTINQPNCKTL